MFGFPPFTSDVNACIYQELMIIFHSVQPRWCAGYIVYLDERSREYIAYKPKSSNRYLTVEVWKRTYPAV